MFLNVRWISTAAALLVAGAQAAAQVNEDAKAILEESADALKALKDVTYSGHRYGEGALKGLLDARGDVKLITTTKDKNRAPRLISGEATAAGRDSERFSFATDGKTVTWVEDDKQTVFERAIGSNSGGKNALNSGNQLILDEAFLSNAPYSRELKAESLTLDGLAEVRGEVCQTVRAAFDDGAREWTWWISQTDRLPRKMQWNSSGGEGKPGIVMVFEMWDVRADTGLKAQELAIATPAGYARDLPEAVAAVPEEAPAEPPQLGLPVGTDAPAFDLASTAGSRVTLESLRGNVIVLHFWGTTYANSLKAFPPLQTVHDQFDGQPVKVLALNVKERQDGQAAEAVKEHNPAFPILLKADDTAKAYQVKGYPSVVIIGKDGKVAQFFQSFPGKDALAAAIQSAL